MIGWCRFCSIATVVSDVIAAFLAWAVSSRAPKVKIEIIKTRAAESTKLKAAWRAQMNLFPFSQLWNQTCIRLMPKESIQSWQNVKMY